jgi:THO complex subunit 5
MLLSLQYYDKEISSKHTFQPSVPDDKLCCITSQDFQQLQQQQNPHQQPQSAHELELERLNYELGQRKQLKAHLQRLLQQKQRAQSELGAARERIDELRGHMEAIKSSSRSLLETSLPESAAISRNREAAELLPLPLYIIYSQAATASSVLGLPISADIAGSTAAAQRLAAAEADAAAAHATPVAADAVQAAKRRRKSEAQEDAAYQVGNKVVTGGAVLLAVSGAVVLPAGLLCCQLLLDVVACKYVGFTYVTVMVCYHMTYPEHSNATKQQSLSDDTYVHSGSALHLVRF